MPHPYRIIEFITLLEVRFIRKLLVVKMRKYYSVLIQVTMVDMVGIRELHILDMVDSDTTVGIMDCTMVDTMEDTMVDTTLDTLEFTIVLVLDILDLELDTLHLAAATILSVTILLEILTQVSVIPALVDIPAFIHIQELLV